MAEEQVLDGASTGTEENANGGGNGEGEGKTYSREDFEKALQSETDKRVAEAIKTAQSKWESDMAERIEKERADAAERAKLSAEELAARDAEAQKQAFEKERAQYKRDKLEFDVTQKLAEKKLPLKFSKYISARGEDNVDESIKELEEMLGEQRQGVVDELTKGSTPKGGGKPQETDPFLDGFGK